MKMGDRRQSDRADRDCLGRLARGDADALDELYRRHSTTAWRHALWVTGSPADADDVLQTVFVRLAGGGVDLLSVRSLRAYLGSMVRHEALRVSRRAAEGPAETGIDPDALLGDAPSGELAAERTLLAARIAELPADQREALVLRVYGGFTFREIGRAAGVSTFTAASRFRLALGRLRKALGGDR
ncbi:MAG: RNA polymerase sigma factor [Planctomycetota bacterium]|jgi:RNA polymerase sigma-70 factor (ECF subfamily)